MIQKHRNYSPCETYIIIYIYNPNNSNNNNNKENVEYLALIISTGENSSIKCNILFGKEKYFIFFGTALLLTSINEIASYLMLQLFNNKY